MWANLSFVNEVMAQLVQHYAHSLVEGGLNLGDGKNSGNNISGSYMPTYNVDLMDQHTRDVDIVDQYCRDIPGWAVTQKSQFDYSTHATISRSYN